MTYADIIEYVTLLQKSTRTLKETYVGDYDTIYDVTNNPDELQLPALWVESPEMTPVGNADSTQDRWNIDLIVLYKGTPQNKHTNQYQQEMSYRTARMILSRIIHDAGMGLIRADIINKTISPIDPLSADWLVGWKISLTMDTRNALGCYDPTDWDHTVGVYDSIHFVVHQAINDLIIVPTVINDPAWSYQWLYSQDNAPLAPLTSMTIPGGALTHTYITLVATHTEGHRREASVFRMAGVLPAVFKSVPYLYSPYQN